MLNPFQLPAQPAAGRLAVLPSLEAENSPPQIAPYPQRSQVTLTPLPPTSPSPHSCIPRTRGLLPAPGANG